MLCEEAGTSRRTELDALPWFAESDGVNSTRRVRPVPAWSTVPAGGVPAKVPGTFAAGLLQARSGVPLAITSGPPVLLA